MSRSAILRAEIFRGGAREISCALEMTSESVFVVTDDLPPVGDRVALCLSFPRTVREVVVKGRVRQVRLSSGPGSPPGFVAEFEVGSAEEREELAALARRVQPSKAFPSARELSLLLVEGNQLLRDMFVYTAQRYFAQRTRKVQVSQAATAAEAWAHLRGAVRPNVILVDHALSDTKGSALISELRADEALRGLPIVGMSVSDNAVRASMLAAGADLFLQKPIVLRDLFCTLEFLMSCEPGSERGAA